MSKLSEKELLTIMKRTQRKMEKDYLKHENKLLYQLTQKEYQKLRRNFDENNHLLNQGKNVKRFEPVVKFFNPVGLGKWYLSELSPDNIGYGICQLRDVELGYVCLKELHNLKIPMGLYIEKEQYFSSRGMHIYDFLEALKNEHL